MVKDPSEQNPANTTEHTYSSIRYTLRKGPIVFSTKLVVVWPQAIIVLLLPIGIYGENRVPCLYSTTLKYLVSSEETS